MNLIAQRTCFVACLCLLALAAEAVAAEPIANCTVTRPSGSCRQVRLQFDVPDASAIDEAYARWTYIGLARDGKMKMDHGIGLRTPGGTLTLTGEKLEGTFQHSRKTGKRMGPVVKVSLKATVADGKITGSAKVGDYTGKLTGTIVSEADLARSNAIPARANWPSLLGPVAGGAAAVPTGAQLVADPAAISLVWTPEETDIGQGIGSISRFMHKWADASGRRTCSGSTSPVAGDGKVFLSYYVPSSVQPPSEKALSTLAEGSDLKPDQLPDYALEKIYPKSDDVVLCMDAATGKTLWKAVIAGRGNNHQHHKEGPFDMTPAYGGGRIFAVGMSNWLYALDARTGQPLWEADLSNSRRSKYSATALVGRKVVVVPRQNKWAAFDAATGKLAWQSDVPHHHVTLALWPDGEKDYFIGDDGKNIVCLDGDTGNTVWSLDAHALSHGRGLGCGGISIHGDILLAYLQEGDDKNRKPFCAAWKLSSSDAPKQLWKISVEGTNAEHVPVVVSGRYVFTGDLACTDLQTGRQTDKTEGVKPGNGGYMLAMEDTVLVRRDGTHGAIEIALYRIGPDGKIRTITPPNSSWRPGYGGSTTSYHHMLMYPLLDGRMFLRQVDGVYCWDMRKKD
ncbi:MAG: PQQ-binding-like beta-propeller repeat protein [Phycisphaerae bacterium]